MPIASRFDLGIRAITALVESEDHDVQRWSDFAQMYKTPRWQLDKGDPRANDLARKVGAKIGYNFNYPRLIRSAFTHSSDTHAPVPDLQRMEFLGDACLDWVCIWWLFDSNPDRNPQWLTEHKMAMVSNKFLAALAVTLDFDKFFYSATVKLISAVSSYAEEARAKYEAFKRHELGPDFWTEITASPPKALADLVESTLGAILIDSNFNLQCLVDFFEAHVLKFFKDISLYDGFANQHPTSFIHKRLTDDYGCQDFKVMNTDPQEGAIETIITAGVLIHDTLVARVQGPSARYAKVRASKQALEVLEGMTRQAFREKYRCNCERGAAMEAAEGR
jgi:endoribonuclease Dicer